MLPAFETDLMTAYGTEIIPSKTYAVDWKNKRIAGYIDELDAMRQSVKLILETERYEWEIYSWGYGMELRVLIGYDAPTVYAILEDKLTEALLADDRILGIENFKAERTARDTIFVSFTVKTIFGNLNEETEVNVNG